MAAMGWAVRGVAPTGCAGLAGGRLLREGRRVGRGREAELVRERDGLRGMLGVVARWGPSGALGSPGLESTSPE